MLEFDEGDLQLLGQGAQQAAFVDEAEVEIVWAPIWNPNMISPEGREKLGMD